MSRRFDVEIDGKVYEAEVRYGGVSGRGEVLVDGEVVDVWGSSWSGSLPKERVFEVAGKKAILRRVGILNQNLELFVPGARVRRVK